ncbi:MAG: hypothetical protein AVDCRST_MAG90-910 [uncultured Microvirga sp.]|uniref:Uncharacterized protein n=1 Tax=uncultured Microvirga sp. TaxID=412392 RepID=A0A6J4KY51_9HYPH|nr:MAG: hypothetical protein AVDCRST_MAG90-910 [uncultured Microvirga sp.]
MVCPMSWIPAIEDRQRRGRVERVIIRAGRSFPRTTAQGQAPVARGRASAAFYANLS